MALSANPLRQERGKGGKPKIGPLSIINARPILQCDPFP